MEKVMGKWESSERYAKENKVRYVVKVNKKTETDVYDQLEKQDNVMGYIKKLIREDIARHTGTRLTVTASKADTEISDDFTEPE